MKWTSENGTLSKDAVLNSRDFVERQKGNSLVKKAVDGEVSFLTESRAYYGIDIRGMMSQPYEPEKRGRFPDNIISVIEDFEGKKLNRDLLKYEDVRKAYQKIHRLVQVLFKILRPWTNKNDQIIDEYRKYQDFAVDAHIAIEIHSGRFLNLCNKL
ncbi:hypothetical protein HY449_03690 [Candidatus Pacearchaeota archaeon]|nr:hypothetical protein [Candidatus Pacearchaeota archaeon]